MMQKVVKKNCDCRKDHRIEQLLKDTLPRQDRNSKLHVYSGRCRHLNRVGTLEREARGVVLSGIKGLISPSALASSFPVWPCFTVFNIKVKYEQLR